MSQRRANGKGKDGFISVDYSNTHWFRGKGKGKHTGSEKSGTSAHHANLTSVEGYDYYCDEDMDESANAFVKPTMTQLIPEAIWTRLLFSLTHVTTILTLKYVHNWYKRVHKLTFPTGRRKDKIKVRAKARARKDVLFDRRICHWKTVDGG